MMTNSPDLRAFFKSFGMGETEATMAIQSAFFIPRTTDPDAQVTIQLVKAIQNGLNDLGANLLPNGILGPKTMKYLRVTSGPLWSGKPWWEILNDIDAARRAGRRFRKRNSKTSLEGYEGMGASPDVITLGAFAVGALLLYQAFKK